MPVLVDNSLHLFRYINYFEINYSTYKIKIKDVI